MYQLLSNERILLGEIDPSFQLLVKNEFRAQMRKLTGVGFVGFCAGAMGSTLGGRRWCCGGNGMES